ncbi:actin-related protein 4-like [Durio zibethinus]|uniref:Actin-related protein 4-like n=1 Tax=Durio zibethinus TaxID=66656 RepID=A0A6P6AM09_DURZI|nr:actin-related protein 4-like [Durio zibethinus]
MVLTSFASGRATSVVVDSDERSTTVALVQDGYVLQKAVFESKESYKLYSKRVIASDIKECVCRLLDTPYDESAYSNVPMTPYELLDGQTIEISADRFKILDVPFKSPLAQTIPGMDNFADISPAGRGLPQVVIESINRRNVDIRK